MNLVFAGSSEFAVVSLEALLQAGHRVLAVLTQPDRAAGRRRKLASTPVKRFAPAANLLVMDPTTLRDGAAIDKLHSLAPDVMVVVDYGLIIPQTVLDIPARGCINGHASLLPRWRGAAPIERAILAGDTETGITVMQMDKGLDTGPMLLVRATPIGPRESAGELRSRLARICADSLVEALEKLEDDSLEAVAQDDSVACYAAKIDSGEARIDWAGEADDIVRKVRAFNPRPGAYTEYGDQRLKILEALALAEGPGAEPGTVFRADRSGIDVAAGTGAVRILTLQLPGGRPMSAAAFVNGHSVLNAHLGGKK